MEWNEMGQAAPGAAGRRRAGAITQIGRPTMLNGYLTRRAWPIGLLFLALLLTLVALVALLPLSPAVEAQSAPATPSSVSLTRPDGTVTARLVRRQQCHQVPRHLQHG